MGCLETFQEGNQMMVGRKRDGERRWEIITRRVKITI
jgi:hypothetical protein